MYLKAFVLLILSNLSLSNVLAVKNATVIFKAFTVDLLQRCHEGTSVNKESEIRDFSRSTITLLNLLKSEEMDIETFKKIEESNRLFVKNHFRENIFSNILIDHEYQIIIQAFADKKRELFEAPSKEKPISPKNRTSFAQPLIQSVETNPIFQTEESLLYRVKKFMLKIFLCMDDNPSSPTQHPHEQ